MEVWGDGGALAVAMLGTDDRRRLRGAEIVPRDIAAEWVDLAHRLAAGFVIAEGAVARLTAVAGARLAAGAARAVFARRAVTGEDASGENALEE